MKRCRSDSGCTTEALASQPYLEFIQLDGPPRQRCGRGDCGAAPDALRQGWAPGHWKIVAPPINGLTPPAPVTIELELEAKEVLDVQLVYRWPYRRMR